MEPAHLLYELQQLDLRIAADGAKLEAERARIQEPPAVREARTRLAGAQEQLTGVQKQLRSTEQEVESVAAKKNAVHAKLYGGVVSAPRELAALESEESALARTLSQLEDLELELMSSAEEAEQAISAGQERLEGALADWRQQGSEAQEQIAQLDAELATLQADRAALAAQASPPNLALYERLRPRKGNRPVALVDKNTCGGCRVELPSGDVHRARGADPPHTCENCGRLLYVP